MFNLYKCFLLSFFITFSSVSSDTIFIEEPAPTEDEKRFMKRYGYLEEILDEGGAYTVQSLSEAVWKVQKFAGLPATGLIDAETRRLFKRRRCGIKDLQDTINSKHRTRRYILQEGWNKKAISYRVLNGSRSLEKSRVESLMAAGLAVWAPHSGLRFVHVAEKADIQVSFASKDHGDGFPFDGPGRVVAHAFPPPHGAMHFDDDELWGESLTEENDDVTDFFAVAVHEIGHALGLSHSNVKESVMYPYYQVPVQKLHEDDIMGLHELYSKLSKEMPLYSANTESSFAPPFTKADSDEYDENDIPDLCYTNYDTIQVIQGKIFVFEEEWMWVLNDRKKIADGYPKRFHDVFVGLPKHITVIRTIYEKQNGHIVVFHKRSFWEFNSQFRFIRRGKLTEYKLPRQVRELTTVFLSNYNNKTYLIEYERYWRMDESTDAVDRGYPKEMSAWRQVPYPVDAAIIWKGDTFFFRGPRFWRFDNNLVQAHEYYPLPTAQIWFPCAPTPDMTKYVTNDER